ncbi:hypothetical protein TNCV_2792091 [Trichonephila clavipes]|nr:hypothetical protein TNCV_2792091 [Trichonephila clavipes]
MQPKPSSLRAQAHQSKAELKLKKAETLEKKLRIRAELERGERERFSSGLHGNTADSVRSEWPLWHAAKPNSLRAQAHQSKSKLKLKKAETLEEKLKLEQN